MEYLANRWDHQIKGEELAFSEYLKCSSQNLPFGYAFFFKPGLGKTFTAINTLRRIMNHEAKFHRVLIISPLVVVANWKDEIKKFSKIDHRLIHTLQGASTDALKHFNHTAFDGQRNPVPGIFITNYDKISMSKDFYYQLQRWKPEFLILDESHRLKDPKSNRTKRVEDLANPVPTKDGRKSPRPHVLLLSGSPILNSALDIYSQFLIMDGGRSFGNNFFIFRAKYFQDKNAGMPKQRYFPKWEPKEKALKDIQKVVYEKSITANIEDCIDLPPLIQKTIKVEMPLEQKRIYEEMRRQLVTYIESNACIAQLAITRALRLMQIASGFIRTEDDKDIRLKDNPKIKALSDLLEDIAPSRKVIVWAVFRENYKMIREVCDTLKLRYVEITGEMDYKEKRQAELDFQGNSDVRVLIGNPGAGGIGINLTASSYSIYYSSNFSREFRDQSAARNYRAGSQIHDSITQVDLIMDGTIEEKILEVLKNKEEISVAILKSMVQA